MNFEFGDQEEDGVSFFFPSLQQAQVREAEPGVETTPVHEGATGNPSAVGNTVQYSGRQNLIQTKNKREMVPPASGGPSRNLPPDESLDSSSKSGTPSTQRRVGDPAGAQAPPLSKSKHDPVGQNKTKGPQKTADDPPVFSSSEEEFHTPTGSRESLLSGEKVSAGLRGGHQRLGGLAPGGQQLPSDLQRTRSEGELPDDRQLVTRVLRARTVLCPPQYEKRGYRKGSSSGADRDSDRKLEQRRDPGTKQTQHPGLPILQTRDPLPVPLVKRSTRTRPRRNGAEHTLRSDSSSGSDTDWVVVPRNDGTIGPDDPSGSGSRSAASSSNTTNTGSRRGGGNHSNRRGVKPPFPWCPAPKKL